MRASHSKAEPLRLKVVARTLLTRELILSIFLVVLALFLLHGRDLKCICDDSSVSVSAELSWACREEDTHQPAWLGGSALTPIHMGQSLPEGLSTPAPVFQPHSIPLTFSLFPRVVLGELRWFWSNNSHGRG